MNRLHRWALKFTPRQFIASATVNTLVALLFMVLPIFIDSPLFLMAAMTLGQVFGLLGVLFFGAAVLREILPTLVSEDTSLPKSSLTQPHENSLE